MTHDRDEHLRMGRRNVLVGAAGLVLGPSLAGPVEAAAETQPIIDSHIHLFDGTRPQGATYMGSKAYAATSRVSLPAGYRKLAEPAGITGAIVIESSPWIEDNLWYLEIARADPIMVGVVGRLDTAAPDFAATVSRYAKDPLYRGIRFTRFYHADGDASVLNPDAVEGMRALAAHDLVLDTANPSMALLKADLLLSKAVPELRIILDHLPAFDPSPEMRPAYEALIDQLAQQPNIFVKLTEVYHPLPDGTIVTGYDALHARLDYLFGKFGEDRVMYGSDYPNSYGVATIPQSVDLMKRFYATKPKAARDKYFWANSQRIYKWRRRLPEQPSLS